MLAVTVGGSSDWNSGKIATLLQTATFANGASFGIDTTGGNFSYGGQIADSPAGPLGLVVFGGNTLTLSGADSYSGGTDLESGTLVAGNWSALGSGSLTVNGGTLDLAGYSITVPELNGMAGTITFDGGTLQYAASFSGPTDISTLGVTIAAGGATIDANGNSVALANAIGNGGSGGLTVLDSLGGGSLTLNAADTYSGGTAIDGCTLNFSSLSDLGSGGITFDGGTLQYAGNFSGATDISTLGVTIAAGGAMIDTNGKSIAFASAIGGSGGLTVLDSLGGGSLTLIQADAYGGGTDLESGTLVVGYPSALGTGGLTVNGGALDLDGYSITVPELNGSGGTITNNGENSPAILTVDDPNNDWMYFGGTLRDGQSTLALVVSGSAWLTLGGDNAYSGGTAIDGGTAMDGVGTVTFSTLDNLGSGRITFDGGTLQYAAGLASPPDISTLGVTIAAGGATIDTNGNSVAFANPIGGSGGLTVIDSSGGGSLTIGGTDSFGGNITVGGQLNIAGALTSSGNLTVESSGVLDNSGTLFINTWGSLYNSGCLENHGTLTNYGYLENAGNLTDYLTLYSGNGGTLDNNGTFTVAASGTAFIGYGGLLEGNNGVVVNGTLWYETVDSATYAGNISGSGELITVAWAPNAYLTLAGDNSGFTGEVWMYSGNLRMGSATALGGPGSWLYGGGTLDLNGYNLTITLQFEYGTITNLSSSGYTPTLTAYCPGGWLEQSFSVIGNLAFVVAGTGYDLSLGTLDASGGTTIDAGNTLWVGWGGYPATLGGNVVDNGTLILSGSLTVSGAISGTGSVQVGTQWSGTVVLTGNDTCSGGTIINAGTLQVGDGTTNGSLAGSIVDQAILVYMQNSAATINNPISGSAGSVIENSGAGELTLTGLNNFYGSLGSGIQT